MISQDITKRIKNPKIENHKTIILEGNEQDEFIDAIEFGNGLSRHQKAYYEKNHLRDLVIVTLILSTGIRVSECVGLDINDINIKNKSIHVCRRKAKKMTLYFGEEIKDILSSYIDKRKQMHSKDNEALFLSLQNTRITTRSVQRLIKKYANTMTTKHITPQKLRNTYGTELYNATHNLTLTELVMNCRSINQLVEKFTSPKIHIEAAKNAVHINVLEKTYKGDI
jgi:integrase/recombinase XerC